jgi:putative ABC transport system permease protein
VVHAVLLRPLPYPESDRLVRVREKGRTFGFMATSYPNFQEWSTRTDLFEAAAAQAGRTMALTGEGDPEQLLGSAVTAGLFKALGTKPTLGRAFLPEEDTKGAPDVVMLSEAVWARRFGRDRKILGRTLTLNGRAFTVVGILPHGFELPEGESDVLVPYVPNADTDRGNHTGVSFALLRRGVSLATVQAALDSVAANLEKQYPVSNTGLTFHVAPMQEVMVRDVRTALLVVLGAVGLVLLIACANMANLTMSRLADRRREMALRAALGASGPRLMRQTLTESLLLSLLGGGAGLLLAWWGVRFLVAAKPPGIPRLHEISLDPAVLGFTLALAVISGLLFGVMPALQALRLDVSRWLKEGARSTAGFRRDYLRRGLVVAEVALAVLPAIGAALLIKSFLRIESTSPGFQPDNVLAMRVALPAARYPNPPSRVTFFRQAVSNIQQIPGVEYAGGASYVPLSQGGNWQTLFDVEGRPQARGLDSRPAAETAIVAGAFFPAMGISLLRGRLFLHTDTGESPSVVVVDETLAANYWPNDNPLGKRIRIAGAWRQVIGVVQHVKSYGVTEPSRVQVYMWAPQTAPVAMTFVVRTRSWPQDIQNAVARQIAAIDKDLPLFNVRTLRDLMSRSVSRQRFSMTLLSLFAGLALVLSAVGIYGVMAHAVTQRAHEIGVRMALGATRGSVLRMLLGQGMSLVGLGLVLGVVAATGLSRVIATMLYGVSPRDWLIFAGVSLVLVLTGMLAILLPARRAVNVDPLLSLRWE